MDSADDVVITVKHLPDLKSFALSTTPDEYTQVVDDFNNHLKDFPQFIRTKPDILDAGIVHIITSHTTNDCRLKEIPHELRDCMLKQFVNWQDRLYRIAEKEKPELISTPKFDFAGVFLDQCMLRAEQLIDSMNSQSQQVPELSTADSNA